MLVSDNRRFIQASFNSEEELEQAVIDNAEYIFGPSSIYFPKSLIRTREGVGTIPDGFVVDLSSRQWFIVEAELSRHSVWSHIAPQVAKQLVAAIQPSSRQLLIEMAVERAREDEQVMEKFADEKIDAIDIRRVLGEILETEPIIGMPIDSVSNDLKEWATTLRTDVRLWIVKKYVEFGEPENIIYELPEEYRPVLDTKEDIEAKRSGIAKYDVTVRDIIDAELLKVGEILFMPYKPNHGQRKTYEGIVQEDGSIELLGKTFSSPSYAAVYGIQDAGSDRTTANGWIRWKNAKKASLADLRDEYLKSRELGSQSGTGE